MTRAGRRQRPAEPERRCIVIGETAPKRGLIRFVIGPDGTLVPDLAGRLPGRGIYVAADRAALEAAAGRGRFARAARRQVRVPEGLVPLVERLLVERLVESLSLARRAGQAVAGREKVAEWLEKGRAALLLQAADGSPRERARLRPPAGPESLVDCLNATELGLAFGRERVIHAALAAGGLAERVFAEAARLAGVRKPEGTDGTPVEKGSEDA